MSNIPAVSELLKKALNLLAQEKESKPTINRVRMRWFLIYLIVGILLLILFLIIRKPALLDIIQRYFSDVVWCSGWSAIGVSLGLYNSRTVTGGNSERCRHYFTYFLFVLGIATLAAFVVFESFNVNIRSYAAAMLAGITIGFLGDKLGEKLPFLNN